MIPDTKYDDLEWHFISDKLQQLVSELFSKRLLLFKRNHLALNFIIFGVKLKNAECHLLVGNL
jgi:hypothetical protein